MASIHQALRPHAHRCAAAKTCRENPCSARLATDTLIAAVHATIIFPCMTRTMDWSDTRLMVKHMVTSTVDGWSKSGSAA